MLRQVLHQLKPLLRRPVLDLLLISVVAVIVGGVEATVLVLVVKAALAIAAGTSEVGFDVPVFHVQVSTGATLVGAACLAVALPLLNATLSKLMANAGTEVLDSARHRAVDTFLAASWEKQSTEREGAVQETVTTFAFQASTLTLAVSGIVSGALSLAALLLVAVIVDVLVTAFVMAFGLLLFVLIRPLSRLTAKRSTKYVRANSKYTEDVARMAVMSMELRVFGAEPAMLESLDESSDDVSQHLRRTRFAARVGATVYRDIAVLFLVLAVGALNILGGDRLGEIGAVALLVVRSLGYATAVQTSLQQVSELSPSLSALYQRFEELGRARERWGSRLVTSFDTIELRGVTYSYDERTPALRDIDLTIEAGEVLGVVGPSGSGKSTLLQVLLRLRTPVEGSVAVDGLDYVDIDPRAWSNLVALVPQEPRLMAASVADNIAFLRPWVSRAEVERAADAAHVGSEIRALPDGFDTMLGPHGTGLSGGQKQRVAFARALVGAPRLLILDEPTSALDGVSERRIQETIADLRGDVTLVIVAHRLSALDVCNRVISIRDGRIEPAEVPHAVVTDEAPTA